MEPIDAEIIYSLLDALLPFEWLRLTFMKNAFLAVLLITPLFGLLSTMVVSSRMVFFSDSLGHGAFTGIALGAIWGIGSPLFSLLVFSLLFALAITYIKQKSRTSTDTVIGVFSATAIALGLMLMSYGGNFNKFSAYLIGDLLSITPAEIVYLAVVFLLVLMAWAILYNRLLLLSINSPLARSRGINALLTESLFAALLALVVAVSIQWVGLLIVNSLLVLPAAGARNLTDNVKAYHLASVGIAMFSGLSGLIIAYHMGLAAGATIVVIAAGIFFLTLGKRV